MGCPSLQICQWQPPRLQDSVRGNKNILDGDYNKGTEGVDTGHKKRLSHPGAFSTARRATDHVHETWRKQSIWQETLPWEHCWTQNTLEENLVERKRWGIFRHADVRESEISIITGASTTYQCNDIGFTIQAVHLLDQQVEHNIYSQSVHSSRNESVSSPNSGYQWPSGTSKLRYITYVIYELLYCCIRIVIY